MRPKLKKKVFKTRLLALSLKIRFIPWVVTNLIGTEKGRECLRVLHVSDQGNQIGQKAVTHIWEFFPTIWSHCTGSRLGQVR